MVSVEPFLKYNRIRNEVWQIQLVGDLFQACGMYFVVGVTRRAAASGTTFAMGMLCDDLRILK